MEVKKNFLASLRSQDLTLILNAIRPFANKDDTLSALVDSLDYFTVAEHAQLWKTLSWACNSLIDQLSNSMAFTEDSMTAENELLSTEKCNEAISSLLNITKILALYIEKFPNVKSEHFIETLHSLHDILIPLNAENGSISRVSELKTTIARLCEARFLSEASGSEGLVTQLLPFLLLISLSPVATDADIKRLYALRSALDLFDFEDQSIESLRGLLLRCFIQPSFLRTLEGKKFLSYVFNIQSEDSTTTNSSIQDYVMEVIKPQIINGSRNVCLAYGDILLRAWKDSKNRSPVEELLQELINEAIHSSNRSQFKGLRLVLSVFHDLKREEEVDSLLSRLYGPFIWRSLKCANAIIRSQAAVFFFDVFPLQDPSLGTEAAESHLQFQFESFTSLLHDNDHRVRAVAASGACTILREYWEAMPPQETRKILGYLINTLSFDSSSAAVRQAVIQGLSTILDQPLSHSVLKKLLPHLSNTIHDNAEKVRLAFIQLLCKIKGVRSMHFYDIVPVAHILERMALDADTPKICLAMGELLLNSFYPQEDESEGGSLAALRTERCLSFIDQNIDAAEAFYSTLHQLTSVGSASKLCVMLFSLFLPKQGLVINNENQNENDKRRKKPSAIANLPSYEFPRVLSDHRIRVGVLRVLISCFGSIQTKLSQSKYITSLELIQKHLTSSNISIFLELFKQSSGSEDVGCLDELSLAQMFCAAVGTVIFKTETVSSKLPKKTLSQDFKLSVNVIVATDELVSLYLKSIDNLVIHSNSSSGELTAEDVISTRRLRVMSTIELIESSNLTNEFLAHLSSLLANDLKLVDVKKVSKKNTSRQSDFPLSLAVDILSIFCGFGSDSELSLSEALFSQILTMFKQVSTIINVELSRARGSFEDSNLAIILPVCQRFVSIWMLVAFQTIHKGSTMFYDELIIWSDNSFSSFSSYTCLSMLMAALVVTTDAFNIPSTSKNATSCACSWIEAMAYIITNPTDSRSIDAVMYEKIIQVCLRISSVVLKTRELTVDQEALIMRVFDVISAASKRYPNQLPAALTKGLQTICARVNKNDSTSESYEHIKSHSLFLSVV